MSSRRLRDDQGAILVIAIIVVTTVALVVGTLLTQGDTSVRATVALRQVAGSSYAADGAAQIAINDLRTGYNEGNGEPADWAFSNAIGTGCFGYNTDGTTVDGVQLKNFYPAADSNGSAATSAYVTCTGEAGTGSQGSAVPITNANKPGNAVLTLGTGGENGFTFKTNGSSGAFRVRGGIWSNSNILRDNNGTLQSTESIRAHSGCTPMTAMQAPVVDCSAGTVADPDYASDLGPGSLELQTPPSTCSSGKVELQPGYYDDASKLNALTPNGGSSCFIHLNPGTYYFDFHNNSADPLFDTDIATSAGDVWAVNSGTIVGGTLTSSTSIPGRCVNPIDDVNAKGVQLVFGGDSRIAVDKGAQMEVCASYRDNRPPIAIYGQKTGAAIKTVVDGANALTTTGAPDVTAGTFTGATAANLQDADGNPVTNAKLAVWSRDATATDSQTGTITMSGFAPSSPLPKGTVLLGARLKLTHMSDGTTANTVTVTPNSGAGLNTYTLPVRKTLGTEDIDLTARTGWGALQKSVHDNGFTGATVKFQSTLKKNETARLDGARLELTYVVPAVRGQADTSPLAIPGNTVAAVAGSPMVKALGNGTEVYIQGTTYAPKASLNLSLNNIAESVFRFGVIARSLNIFETASFLYPGPVIELPDNSPGYGFNGPMARLKVYLCPGSSTCNASSGELALTSRVQLWDPTGTPVPGQRQVSVLSWSHQR